LREFGDPLIEDLSSNLGCIHGTFELGPQLNDSKASRAWP
jgi:hypothetical protein